MLPTVNDFAVAMPATLTAERPDLPPPGRRPKTIAWLPSGAPRLGCKLDVCKVNIEKAPNIMTDTPPGGVLWPVRLCRFVVVAARRFYGDRCLLHASALAYTSLLSLVPLLALMFAILKGLGVQRRIEPVLLSRLGLEPEVTERILTYIDRTNVGALGALGAIALIATVVSVLGSIESTFNHIWRVRRARSLWRKVADYTSTVMLTPFLLLTAVAVTSSVREQGLLRMVFEVEYVGEAMLQSLRLAPLAINFVALAVLYAVMTNRRPHLPAVLAGALLAGCAWQVVQWSYVSLQIGVVRYNAIYGALAQLPVTLVWIYLSWIVVLAGAEVAAVWEYGSDFGGEAEASARWRWAIVLHVLLRASEAFRTGKSVNPAALARELRIDAGVVLNLAEELQEAGFLAAVDRTPRGYVLAHDPATIDLAMLEVVSEGTRLPAGCDPRVFAALQALAADRHSRLRRLTLVDVLNDEQAGNG